MSEYIYCDGCKRPVAILDGSPGDEPLGCAPDCPDTSGAESES